MANTWTCIQCGTTIYGYPSMTPCPVCELEKSKKTAAKLRQQIDELIDELIDEKRKVNDE